MKHYAGLDVSVKETSVCIVDESGKLCRERKVASQPEDLVAILSDPSFSLERVGVEAGPLSQWLFEGLARAGLPICCIETRHTKAFLDALQQNSLAATGRGRPHRGSRAVILQPRMGRPLQGDRPFSRFSRESPV